MDDSTYEAIATLLRGVIFHEHSGGKTPEHLVGQVRRAIAILSPAIAAEVEHDGAARVYEERWSEPADHSASIAEDIRRGRTSEQIRDEIISKVGMLGDAQTPEMQTRYDAAVAREQAVHGKPLTRKEQLEAARNLEPDCEYGAVGGARRCGSCGRYGGGHEADCRKVRREEQEKLQTECDHREQSIVQTTGDPPGPPCCGRCGLELPAELISPTLSH